MKMRNFKDERFKGWCSRSMPLKFDTLDEKTRSVECIMTTEDPAIVFDWWNWKYIREIIFMKGIEFEKEIPFINSHKRDDIENFLGTTKEIRTEGDLLVGRNYFSSTAEKAWTLTKEGHLKNYSVGYQIYEEDSNILKTGQEIEIDGRKFINNYADGMDLVIRKRATIKENSSVILGADKRAKARAEGGISAEDEDLQDELEKMFEKFEQKLDMKINSIKSQGDSTMDEPIKKTQDQLRLEAINEIKSSMANYGKDAKVFAEKTIDEILQGKEITDNTLKEFFKSATDIVIKNGGAANKPISYMGLTGKEMEGYSPTRAAQALLSGKRSGKEFEISDDIQKRTGLELGDNEIFVPSDVTNIGLRQFMQKGHSYGTPTEGAEFSTSDFRADLLKDVIMNDTVLGRLGATVITGLRGQFQMPKIVSGLTNYVVAENAPATATSYIVTGLETCDPKHMAGDTVFGRLLFMMIDPALGGFDTILMNQLIKSRNVKLDYLGVNGTGVGIQPKGILNQSGPAAPSLSIVDFKSLVNIKRLVAKANGLKENMKFGASVDVECMLEVTPKLAGQPYGFLMQDGKIIGYNYESSNQIPDADLIFGLWPEFFILNWGVEKLTVADQPLHKNDQIEISLHSYFNFFLRSSESFAIVDDATVDIFGV